MHNLTLGYLAANVAALEEQRWRSTGAPLSFAAAVRAAVPVVSGYRVDTAARRGYPMFLGQVCSGDGCPNEDTMAAASAGGSGSTVYTRKWVLASERSCVVPVRHMAVTAVEAVRQAVVVLSAEPDELNATSPVVSYQTLHACCPVRSHSWGSLLLLVEAGAGECIAW